MARKAKSAGRGQPAPRSRFKVRSHVAINYKPPGRILLHRFVSAVKAGEVLHADLLRDVAARFQQILDGTNPDKALDLQPGKGVKRTVKQQLKEAQIADEVADLYEKLGPRTLARAYERVGTRHHLSESQVKKIYLAERRRRPEQFPSK